jgi:hypothetical protein
MGYPKIAPTVFAFLAEQGEGKTWTADQLVQATSTPERTFTPEQIGHAINNGARTGRISVHVISAGRVWKYLGAGDGQVHPQSKGHGTKPPAVSPPPASSQPDHRPGGLFESVQYLKGGKLLLQDESGNLWVARALDHL